jgi:hypothetical protein
MTQLGERNAEITRYGERVMMMRRLLLGCRSEV